MSENSLHEFNSDLLLLEWNPLDQLQERRNKDHQIRIHHDLKLEIDRY